MKGGAFLAQGADTCVYKPVVDCVPGTQDPAGALPPGNYVSRIVDIGSEEGMNQRTVKDAIAHISDKLRGDPLAGRYLGGRPLASYFNVAVATCTPVLKAEDVFDGADNWCENQAGLDLSGRKNGKINFITPAQDEDVYKLPNHPRVAEELRKLFHAVVYLNNELIVHTDAHFGNVSWMGDHMVMNDWGRTALGVAGFKKFIEHYNLRDDASRRKMKMGEQFELPCRIMDLCPIRLEYDDTSLRFMKFWDVASMSGGAMDLKVLKPDLFLEFGNRLVGLWHNEAIKTEDLSTEVHKAVDELFDKVAPRQVAPLPEAEISPISQMSMSLRRSSPPRAPPPPPTLRATWSGGLNQTQKFCKCIKKVRKTIKNEKGPIAICVKSVLQKKGRTLKRFTCGKKGRVITQKAKH
jgi:hypothetical protein